VKNRIEQRFADLKKARRKAMVAFVTAGDPTLKFTPQVAWTLEEAGVDILELGMPFSDPMADGPVIQKSNERALKSGASLKGVLKAVEATRKKSQIPILLMGYFNPLLQYGIPNFFRDAKRSGVDGMLLVDLPPEEGEETRKAAQQNGVSLVYLLAPTSDQKRIDLVRKKGSGFTYYVSLTGITGGAIKSQPKLKDQLHQIMNGRRLPVCVGFGIKTPEQAREVAKLADGVVVGSSIVDCFATGSPAQGLLKAKKLVTSLAKAVHSV